MSDHDPLCEDKDGPRYGQYCDCRLIDKVRADERKRIADQWQWGGWTVVTPKVKEGSVLGVAQVVTHWLRDASTGR